ncbi:translation initiation factor IF-2 [Gammaproteobacteria bacterium 45_16_T64]|nr:translation initiation factor IF-2 [Gammaproteobacteria bacterium 45_16_T64]
MAEVTVAQLAEVVGIPVEKLLQQMKDAGLGHGDAGQQVSDEEKQTLLAHLKQSHGAGESEPKKITLRRKSVSTLKVSGSQGRSKTVNVEVRKKRTYVKRSVVDLEAKEETSELERKAEEEKAQLVAAEEARIEAKRSADAAAEKAKAEAARKKSEKSAETPSEPTKSKEELAAERKVKEEKAASDLAVKKEEDRIRQEATVKAEAELAKKTQTEAKRIADELANRKVDVKKEEVLDEEKDAIVKAAFEDSLDREAKRTKRGPKRGAKKKPILSSPTRTLKSKSAGDHGFKSPTGPIVHEVIVPENITVADLAQRMSKKGSDVVKVLFKMGVMATINQAIEQEVAVLVVEELGHTYKLQSDTELEDNLVETVEAVMSEGQTGTRAPVVTIMGHVDHGKTSLLDCIRKSKVAAGEAGGITQHIGAYHVETGHGMITFLDTPGHAAFTAMRARGANSTDIVVLVVAADDGMMPQTAEAVDHARAAGVPIIVAVNKMDKEEADPDRVKNDLSAKEVIPEEWGGDTQFLPVSAITGAGITELLDAILLQSEMLELNAVQTGPAKGVVIESRVDKGRGVVASLLVQGGELNAGDMVLAGEHYGRVRAMSDEDGKSITKAGPSIPIEILGLAGAPGAGEDFMVVADERKAKEVAEFRQQRTRASRLARQQAAKLDNIFENMGAGQASFVNIVLKTDVRGSLEALSASLNELSTDEVKVSIVSSGVGGINESDVNLALTSGASIIGFNVRADGSARKLCQEEGIELRYYSVIYDIIDDIKKAMSGLLSPELREEILGVADVRDVFRSSKFGAVAGCRVVEGTIYRNKPIRVLRDDIVIYEGELESLRRFKDDVSEVANGVECGIAVKSYNDVKPGDKIEVFSVTEIARTI